MSLLFLLSYPKKSDAIWGIGDIVYDPSNYANTLMTEFNTLKSTINEATMIANQIRMIESQIQQVAYAAQNLQANPLTLLDQIQGLWSSYNALMQNAEGLSYILSEAGAKFDYYYPQLKGSGLGMAVGSLGRFNNFIVILKVTIVLLVIGFGFMYVNQANWHPFVPPNTGVYGHYG